MIEFRESNPANGKETNRLSKRVYARRNKQSNTRTEVSSSTA